MGLFGKKKKEPEKTAVFFGTESEEEPDIYDEDEVDELMTDSALFFEAPPLESTVVTITPHDIYSLSTDECLEKIEELPYEFRFYLDTRRAFSRALKSCREEIADFESYEGGRSAYYNESFEYDDHEISIDFTLSRDSDSSPYRFTAEIKVDE